MMRWLFLVSGVLIAGCVTPEDYPAYQASTYGPQCAARGFPAGSKAYRQCVTDLDIWQRQNYFIMQQNNYNFLQQRPHCFRVNNTLQCG